MGQLAEKFGRAGKKGEEGETFAMNLWKSIGYKVKDYRLDMTMQRLGIDYAIKKVHPKPWYRYYTVDNKNNLQYRDGTYIMPIELTKGRKKPGWFYSSHADRISHSNVRSKKLISYDLQDMRKVLLPLIEKGEIIASFAKSKCKMIYVDVNDKRIKHLIREVNG